eukprot:gene11195-17217_t
MDAVSEFVIVEDKVCVAVGSRDIVLVGVGSVREDDTVCELLADNDGVGVAVKVREGVGVAGVSVYKVAVGVTSDREIEMLVDRLLVRLSVCDRDSDAVCVKDNVSVSVMLWLAVSDCECVNDNVEVSVLVGIVKETVSVRENVSEWELDKVIVSVSVGTVNETVLEAVNVNENVPVKDCVIVCELVMVGRVRDSVNESVSVGTVRVVVALSEKVRVPDLDNVTDRVSEAVSVAVGRVRETDVDKVSEIVALSECDAVSDKLSDAVAVGTVRDSVCVRVRDGESVVVALIDHVLDSVVLSDREMLPDRLRVLVIDLLTVIVPVSVAVGTVADKLDDAVNDKDPVAVCVVVAESERLEVPVSVTVAEAVAVGRESEIVDDSVAVGTVTDSERLSDSVDVFDSLCV